MDLPHSSDSSPSLPISLPSPPTRYLDPLPPELIRFVIIQVSAGRRFLQRGDTEATLRSLCLTSKLRTFSQPILLEQVDFGHHDKDARRVESLLKYNSAESLALVRVLRFQTARLPLDTLLDLARSATNLQELFVSGGLDSLTPFLGASESQSDY